MRREILDFVRNSPEPVGTREVLRAFGLDASERSAVKEILRSERPRKRRRPDPAERRSLPRVMVVEVSAVDADGELLARPADAASDPPAPTIYMAPENRGHPALAPGDRVLARLTPQDDGTYEGRTIRRLLAQTPAILGVFEKTRSGGRIRSLDRRHRADFIVAAGDTLDAATGDLVRAATERGRSLGLPRVRVVERIADIRGPSAISTLSVHAHGVPMAFTEEALAAAAAAVAAPIEEGREDLRDIPLVTIDGTDARDFDDAVWAEPDPAGSNPGGWHLLVAIADVAWYVRPGSALDRVARERGNSVYFPDRVVPMLPEGLSNGWCSLIPGENRPCLAVHIWIDAEGTRTRHRFVRAVMRSARRLTYEQVQAAHDGAPGPVPDPLVTSVIRPLYGAYEALARARQRRGVLDFDLPEPKVVLDADGTVERFETRARYDSHRLIEEFMIATNVAAAETLERRRQPCMYRSHDEPPGEKLEALRQVLDTLGLNLARGQVMRPALFARILETVAGTPDAAIVGEVILRCQAQAEYGPRNIGHFGLALRRYCHFTSPIRRYADLLVHRALIEGLRLGEGGLGDEVPDYTHLGRHLSETERRATAAERDALDRYAASFLEDRIGTVLSGRISGVTRFGLFVRLDESGADGLVPLRTLQRDRHVHDPIRHTLRAERSGREYRLGEPVDVVVREADPVRGAVTFSIVDGPSAGEERASRRGRSGGQGGTRSGPSRRRHQRRR